MLATTRAMRSDRYFAKSIETILQKTSRPRRPANRDGSSVQQGRITMVEKKVTDIKSVTLGDVKAGELKSDVKRVVTAPGSTTSSTESKNAKNVKTHDKTIEKNKDILKHEYDEMEKKWEEGDDNKEKSIAKKIAKDETKDPPEPMV
jgi:hypothetical protein